GMIEYHRNLLADELRTNAYRKAIQRTVKKGDVVLDIGCGSGILSFFACEAGASKVYAIDRGGMAGVAQFLTRHLGFEDRITVLRDESTSVEISERADVVITETMGVLGLDENILGSIIDARTRLLRPGAAVVPQQLKLMIVPGELPEFHEKHVAWWNEKRYGFDLSPLRVFASNSILFINLADDAYLAKPASIIDLDLTTATSTLARGRMQFTAKRSATVHGFGLWFVTTLVDGITITNIDPGGTHWGQGFLPLEYPIDVARGANIEVDLETDDGRTWRWRGKAGREEFDQTTLFASVPFG
ncbi:MAG TPA: 50S ribosomal protein L11 methyltransferase, partial [Thermoanaerobaculia bacterium]|nr:50S ribosomal protein L11 methyltransferase [Thermoanaerobaculia bacterium]